MRIVSITLALTVLLIVSCSSSDQVKKRSSESKNTENSKIVPNKDLLIIDIDNIEKSIGKYSDFYSSAKYIPLETNKESMIGKIEHIEIFNDTLLVFDKLNAKAISLFDLSGKFIRKIGKIGRGPNEWVQPVSFSVNKKNRELMILDGSLQKIFRYSLSGKFLGKIKLSQNEIRSNNIECFHDKIFLDARFLSQSVNTEYLLREIDTEGETINTWFDANQYNKNWHQGKNPWYFSGSGTLFSAPKDIKYVDLFMDTIYSINEKGISPSIVLKTNTKFSPRKIYEIIGNNPDMTSFIRAAENVDGIYAIRSYIENDDIIRFIFSQARNYREVIIDKKTMTPVCLKQILNDVIFKTEHDMYYPDFFCGDKKLIVGQIKNLKHFQKCLVNEETNLQEDEKMKLLRIQPTDNPLLILLQTK